VKAAERVGIFLCLFVFLSLSFGNSERRRQSKTKRKKQTSETRYSLALPQSQWQSGFVEIGQFILKTPGTCGGRARLAGKRIPVSSIYRWFLHGCEPEDILEKYEGVVLAEIYAAISYALANLEEITGEIQTEDRLSSQASHSRSVEPVRS
jgi:uncharacterized protein (DUF433 family)